MADEGLTQATTPVGLVDEASSRAEVELLELLTEWIQTYHRDGGDFSIDAIAAAGETGRDALRSGYSVEEAFQAARSAYFDRLPH